MDSKILFKETQKFRQWWLWLILAYVLCDALWITIKGINTDKHYTFEHTGLPLLLLILPVALFLFILSIKLETEIKDDGIYARFFPIHKHYRYYPWTEIEKVYIRHYNPIMEYGGWGLRGFGKNRALNVSGNQGLQLMMKDGRKLLIGTRKPEYVNQLLTQSNLIKP